MNSQQFLALVTTETWVLQNELSLNDDMLNKQSIKCSVSAYTQQKGRN